MAEQQRPDEPSPAWFKRVFHDGYRKAAQAEAADAEIERLRHRYAPELLESARRPKANGAPRRVG